MTRLLVLCCFSLLLAGVFCADVTLSVMKGDDVTLSINPEEIREAKLFWKFHNKDIATIDLEEKNSQAKYFDNERFRNRLYLDRNTGSLTINNFTTEDTGEYKLKIRGFEIKFKTFSVTVNDQGYTVSVIKGDAVTLPTGVKLQPHDVQLKFKGNIIPGLTDARTGELSINIKIDTSGEHDLEINASDFILRKRFCFNVSEEESVSRKEEEFVILQTNSPTQSDDVIEWKFKNTSIALFNRTVNTYSYPNAEKKDRLQMDGLGSLTIQQLKTKDSGHYDVYINNSNRFIHKRFSLTVIEVELVSQTRGESVILQTNTPTQPDDVIEWKFKNTVIAQFNRTVNTYSYPNAEKKDRLQMEPSGSLTIQQLKTEDSGHYDVYINNSNRFFHKRFSLTVIEPDSLKWYYGLCIGLAIGLVIGLVIGITLTVIYFVKKSKKK